MALISLLSVSYIAITAQPFSIIKNPFVCAPNGMLALHLLTTHWAVAANKGFTLSQIDKSVLTIVVVGSILYSIALTPLITQSLSAVQN
jgi:hypothetical protein